MRTRIGHLFATGTFATAAFLVSASAGSRARGATVYVSGTRTSGSSGVARFDTATGAGALFGSLQAEETEGVAVDPDGFVYVNFNTLGYGGVVRIDPATETGTTIVPAGSAPQLTAPFGMTFGPADHNLYVASNGFAGIGTTGILRYSSAGTFLGVFVPAGSGGLTSTYEPLFGRDGELYVASSDAVRRYDGTTGAYLDTFVTAGSGGFGTPTGIDFGPDGNLYVADEEHDAVLRFDGMTGAFMDTFVAPGSGGLDLPRDIAFGPDGRLYVASWRGPSRVLAYDGKTGAYLATIDPTWASGLSSPQFLAFAVPEPSSAVVSALLTLGTVLARSTRRRRRCRR
jgi:streptogramin lyase